MQAENQNQFRERIVQAISAYGRASESYAKLSTDGKQARCDAMLAYMKYWFADNFVEKGSMLNEAWKLAKDAFKLFRDQEDAVECARTYNQLSETALLQCLLEWHHSNIESTIKSAIETGDETIRLVSRLADHNELSKAYVKTASFYEIFSVFLEDEDQQRSQREKARNYWLKAKQLSEKVAILELPISISQSWDWKSGTDESFKLFNEALEYSRETGDKLLTGGALEHLAIQAHWRGDTTEDYEERLASYERWLRYAEEAKKEYTLISFFSSSFFSEAPYSHYYWHLADLETDLQRRRSLLQKAVDAARNQVKTAKLYPHPHSVFFAHMALYMALTDLAKTETNSEEKIAFLKEALEHAEEAVRKSYGIYSYNYRNVGIAHSFLGDIRSQLAKLAADSESKENLLRHAVFDKEAAVKLLGKDIPFLEKTGSTAIIARTALFQRDYGNLLVLLYEQTHNEEDLRRAAKAFEHLAELFQKGNFASRMAECYWKAAQTYDTLEEYLQAAERFSQASEGYKKAAEKLPQLKEFYLEHSLYMSAWSEIEKARQSHKRHEFDSARKHYETAAGFHNSTKRWNHLAQNYVAWAKLENAEELTRTQVMTDAARTYEEAAKLFEQAKISLAKELPRVQDSAERILIKRLINAAEIRQEYCTAMTALEEARILDKKGEHFSSSEKYGEVAGVLERMIPRLDEEDDRREIKRCTCRARAWQKMSEAEAEAQPELYLEASRLFEQAKDLSRSEKGRMHDLGLSRFCKAMEVGTRFGDTRAVALHSAAMEHLESAANYFLKAGFENASEYTEGCKLLFDAYVCVDKANKETDHESKAKMYLAAEKLLSASADFYGRAEYPAKKEEVIRLLDKVRKEKELAISLTEIFHGPTVTTLSTGILATPTAGHEKPVGLERFEHADIQANITAKQNDLKVGEDFLLQIELVNAGRGSAQLMKVEDLIPDGFEVRETPERYRIENKQLNMKGKQLSPLRTEEVKLVLRSKVRGQFVLRPRILYIDEGGKYKSHEPEPLEVTVKELGISGWVRGH